MYSTRWPAQATHRIAHSPASERSSLASWPARRVGCMCACCLLFRQVQYEVMSSTMYGYSRMLRVDDRGSDTARQSSLPKILRKLFAQYNPGPEFAHTAVGRWTDGWLPSPSGLLYVCYVWCRMLDASFLESLDLPCLCLACRDSQP